MKKPLIIGITGKIASGKSSLIKAIVEKYNTKKIFVLNCDNIFKETISKNNEYLDDLAKVYVAQTTSSIFLINDDDGSRKLNPEVIINGMYSGGTNFCSIINDIGWGYFKPIVEERIKTVILEEYDIILLETALLWETPICYKCDIIIDLITDFSIRKDRVLKRDIHRSNLLTRKLIDIQGALSNRYNRCWRDAYSAKCKGVFNLGAYEPSKKFLEEFLNTYIDATSEV